jgi:hypothetical protein
MMEAVYCESHGRFELFLEKPMVPTQTIALNEDVPAEHHRSKWDSSYVHAGPVEGCEFKC